VQIAEEFIPNVRIKIEDSYFENSLKDSIIVNSPLQFSLKNSKIKRSSILRETAAI